MERRLLHLPDSANSRCDASCIEQIRSSTEHVPRQKWRATFFAPRRECSVRELCASWAGSTGIALKVDHDAFELSRARHEREGSRPEEGVDCAEFMSAGR